MFEHLVKTFSDRPQIKNGTFFGPICYRRQPFRFPILLFEESHYQQILFLE